MNRSVFRLFVGALVFFAFSTPFAGGRVAPTGGWLDRPLTDWNRPDGRPPVPPDPPDIPDLAAPAMCNEQLRRPVTAAERALVKRGWKLFGAAQTFNATQVVMATTGFDGMCRPLGYQALVYCDGRYAGRLAPVAMNARTDGALKDVTLVSPAYLVAEFDRYAEDDPACCPSRTAIVTYELRCDDAPTLKATEVVHRPACPQGAAPPPPAALGGRRWTLINIEGETVTGGACFIEFNPAERRATGSDGCNRFTGDYEAQGDRLTFSQLAGTKRACLDEAARKLEMRFNQALPKVNRFEVLNNQLRLYGDGGLLLTFSADTPGAVAGGAATPAGKRWTLVNIEGEAVGGVECFIEFEPSNRRVSGSDGCNRFMGRYEIRGDRLTFSQLAGTKRACLDEAARKLETRFNRALPKVNRFAVRDSQLMLYNGDRLLMTLTAN